MTANHFVVDTNILVSAFVFKSKKPTDALKRCLLKGKVMLSSDLIEEYRSTLLSEKFDPIVSRSIREAELALLIDSCDLMTPNEKITICRDADDNKLLELAVAAGANCIITGDKDLLALHPFRGILILTPADFLHEF